MTTGCVKARVCAAPHRAEQAGKTTNATSIVIAGLIATATADVWQQLLKHWAGLLTGNWIGRWARAMGRGAFVYAGIGDPPPVEGERAIGWTFHYAVGIAYAALYATLVRALPDASPSLMSTLLFGIATLAAPWFVLQPAFGFCVMAWRLPKRRAVFWVTATTHLAFGSGIYAGFCSRDPTSVSLIGLP